MILKTSESTSPSQTPPPRRTLAVAPLLLCFVFLIGCRTPASPALVVAARQSSEIAELNAKQSMTLARAARQDALAYLDAKMEIYLVRALATGAYPRDASGGFSEGTVRKIIEDFTGLKNEQAA